MNDQHEKEFKQKYHVQKLNFLMNDGHFLVLRWISLVIENQD